MAAPPLNLYLLRHGETERTRENVYCGAGLDPGLTEEGHAMARAFANAYREFPWAGIYCSPQLRTRQTAAPICGLLGREPVLHDGLKEIGYGQWEGLTLEEIGSRYHDDYLRWTADPAWYPPTGGEPAVVIARRALRVVEEIQAAHGANSPTAGGTAGGAGGAGGGDPPGLARVTGGNVLVVSHKATIRILLCALLGIDVGRFRYRLACPVGSVNVVQFTRHGPMLLAMADRTHLDARLRGLSVT